MEQLARKHYWGRRFMPTEETANVVTHVSAGVTVTGGAAFFSMQWWNENSAGIVAICAVLGLLISLISFVLGRIARYRTMKEQRLQELIEEQCSHQLNEVRE